MSGWLPMEHMTSEEIARLKLRYTNRDGSAEVLCSKAWAHITLQDAEIARLTAENEKLRAALEEIIQDSFSVYAIQVARAALSGDEQ